MLLHVAYVYPMKARMPRQRNDREYYVRDSVTVRCAAPDESDAPVVLRWHQATVLGNRPDREAPTIDFRLHEGHLHRTVIRHEPYGDGDRKVLSPDAAVAVAFDPEHRGNIFLGKAGAKGDFSEKQLQNASFVDADDVDGLVVSWSGKERVLAEIHAVAARSLWIGNEVAMRCGEPIYIVEDGWGDTRTKVKVRTADTLCELDTVEYPNASEVFRADAIYEVLDRASGGSGEYDPDDPETFRTILPAYIEVFDPGVLSYVHDQAPLFRVRMDRAVSRIADRLHLEPTNVITAWGQLRDAVMAKVPIHDLEIAAQNYVDVVAETYPGGRHVNWRAEDVSRQLDEIRYSPIVDEVPASPSPAPR